MKISKIAKLSGFWVYTAEKLRYYRPSEASHKQPRNGPLAQSVEHLTFNQVVVGSIPTRPTIISINYNQLVMGWECAWQRWI
jgi:hypothetical protein